MPLRAIQNVPGLDPKGTPFERLREFTRPIVRIPKEEADKEVEKSKTKMPPMSVRKDRRDR